MGVPSAIKAIPRPLDFTRRIVRRPIAVNWCAVAGERAPAPALRYPADTFGYRNDSRIRHRGKPDLYANWCIVIGRAVIQFQRVARFEPAAPRVAASAYTALVRQVVAVPPWTPHLRDEARVVVPGFACLHEFTELAETAVKAGLSGRLWTWLHPTNWRIALPSPPGEQARTALELIDEVRAGRPALIFISDFPKLQLNHSVVVYDYHVTSADAVEFTVYDPNDAQAPGRIRFDVGIARFVPVQLIGVDVPSFRAFRIHPSEGC